jgi:hypothetical protein
MADLYLTTVIPVAGTLLGALGGIALNSWAAARQDDRQARREDRRAAQQRGTDEASARLEACASLLEAATQLRVLLDTLGQRQWPDMNIKLQAAQDQAASVARYAARVTLLIPGPPGEAALSLSRDAGQIVAQAAREAQVGAPAGPGVPYAGGVLRRPLDLSQLDAGVAAFGRAASASTATAGADPAVAVPAPRSPETGR